MAQRYEIEAWLGGKEQWGERLAQVTDEIEAAGTDDEDVWAAVARRADGETLDSLGRELVLARRAAEQALAHVRGMAILATAEGMSESEAARLARVDRMTVRKWLGKR